MKLFNIISQKEAHEKETLTTSSSAQGTMIDPISTDVTATTDAAEDKPDDLLSDAEVNSYLVTFIIWSVPHNIQKLKLN